MVSNVINFKAKGSNCVYKWLVVRPFFLEADILGMHENVSQSTILVFGPLGACIVTGLFYENVGLRYIGFTNTLLTIKQIYMLYLTSRFNLA